MTFARHRAAAPRLGVSLSTPGGNFDESEGTLIVIHKIILNCIELISASTLRGSELLVRLRGLLADEWNAVP